MTRSVRLLPNIGNAELEAVIPIDRVVEIDDFGTCSLADQQFTITESMIEVQIWP
jgi:hypothetical protein